MRFRRVPPRARIVALLLSATLCGLIGCGDPSSRSPAAVSSAPPSAALLDAPLAHLGDLKRIRGEGELRLLALRSSYGFLPRSGSPAEAERRLAEGLAQQLGLEPTWIFVDRFDDLVPALLDGRGDLIVDNFTATPERRDKVAFSMPVAAASEVLVTRASEPELKKERQLRGQARRIAVRPSSSFWETAVALQSRVTDLEIESAPEELDTDALLDGVAQGRFDLALADSNLVHSTLGWRNDIRIAFEVGAPQMIAWAMRPDSVRLRRAVDGYLAARSARSGGAVARDDLDGIRERGVLRVLTRNSASTYFIWKGELLGFEYDLARRFADRHGLRLEVVVPPSRSDLIPWLLDGRGDLVAAGLTKSQERADSEGVRFSRNYLKGSEIVVTRADDTGINSPEDLAGRKVVVRRSSSYWSSLEDLVKSGIPLQLLAAPEDLETEQLIAGVAEGRYDVTVSDSHILDVELSWRRDVRAAFTLREKVEHGWATRPDNPDLSQAINAFLKSEYRGLIYNTLVAKYFKDPHKLQRQLAYRSPGGTISPYDELVRKYARRYGFDWRLIVAQMHQESRFDPSALSYAGAQGLLQVLPRTGRELGFESLMEPDEGVHAGVRYLAWIRERMGDDVPEKTWLSLAAYNAGYGHLRDARRIARERGLDPNRWFGHVEQAMLLKEQPEVYRQTRFGYARGREPVEYVRSIRDRYDAYLRVAEPL